MNYYEGNIITIHSSSTEVKSNAFSVELDNEKNYILRVYVADPITGNEKLIEKITKAKLELNDSGNTFSVKSNFRNYSLSETEEKPSFCFEFKISPNGKLLDFKYGKQNIMVDIEMTYDDVYDVLKEEGEFYEFLCTINELSDILYSKRNAGAQFERYGRYVDYNLTFPREFNVLVNMLLAEHFNSCNVPFIYDVEEYDKYKNHMKFWYYTSTPTKTVTEKNPYGYYYGAFTSPLKNFEDLKDLEIFNEFMIKQHTEEEFVGLRKKYALQLDGYKRAKEEKSLGNRRR